MKNADSKFEWINCDGGPLLLVEKKYLSAWKGSSRTATDYDRACDVENWLGLIEIGEGKGLVLGGDEFSATWLSLPEEKGGALVRWVYAESENDLITAARSVLISELNEEIFMLIEDSNLILLAACEASNDEIYQRLKVNLPRGKYAISTNEFEDESTSVICHKFRKIAEVEI